MKKAFLLVTLLAFIGGTSISLHAQNTEKKAKPEKSQNSTKKTSKKTCKSSNTSSCKKKPIYK